MDQEAQNQAHMVYPPPPPPETNDGASLRSSTSPLSRMVPINPVQLPSMGTWAPTSQPSHLSWPHTSDQAPQPQSSQQSSDSQQTSNLKRRPSDQDEVEAGMTLTGLARKSSSPPTATATRRRKAPAAKKAKKEETPVKRVEKESRKSCSECRRLKAKCDRVFPCSNCRRRGCALVCPDGDLSCMQGKRLVLASTEDLHERVSHPDVRARRHADPRLLSSRRPWRTPIPKLRGLHTLCWHPNILTAVLSSIQLQQMMRFAQ